MRAQLRREMAKEKGTKSGQSTDELYSSNWIYYGKFAFLVPVIGDSKSRDTLKRINLQEDENEKEVGGTPVAKRKALAEKKLDLDVRRYVSRWRAQPPATKSLQWL